MRGKTIRCRSLVKCHTWRTAVVAKRRGAGAPERGRGPGAPGGREAGRGPAAHVAGVPKGYPRILTVSADTELVSAPAYLRAAQHAPALNNFGSAVSIIQDELAHAHIGYRLLGDLGVDMGALIYEREPAAFKYPYAFDVPLDSWHELVWPTRSTTRPASCCSPTCTSRARSGPGSARWPRSTRRRPSTCATGARGSRSCAPTPSRRPRIQAAADWMFILTLEWFGLPDERKRHGIQLEYGFKGRPTTSCARRGWRRSCRSWRRSGSRCPPTTRTASAGSSTARSRAPSTPRPSAGCSTRPSRGTR